ncbi:MAG: 2-oxoacid:acceptor oxidoreductase family protein [Desulfobacteraceae bacterium]|nr:MAG: 2-oxoacid:acceptor oxidoreductase family protein [Desulfobacteraceae bacterium]
MKGNNIYLAGVGGQGIGLLTEIIVRAADHAGLKVKGVDTYGLAQRGGIVVSQVRFGENVYSPLIPQGQADTVIALERHEALRAMNGFLKDGGTIIYYNAVWQPLEVRLNEAEEVSEETISQECLKRGIREIKVFKDDLKDTRMQNIVLLAHIDKHGLIPEIRTEHYTQAMEDLMRGDMLENNMKLFDEESA